MLHLIHLLEGALLLYYTPPWECLAIVLYCTLPLPMAALLLYSPYIVLYTYLRGLVLYYTPAWGDLVLYYIVLYTFLKGPCYCTIMYYTLTWGGPAIVLVTGGGGRLSHFHQLSKLFYSILCPNMKIKKKNQHFIINVDWFSIISTPQTIYTQWNNLTNSTHGYVIPRKSFFMLSDCWNWQSIGIWLSFVNKPAIYWPTPWDQ